MNFKRTFSAMFFCILIYSVFSVVMVYAPKPDDTITPFQQVLVQNADPIPVNFLHSYDTEINEIMIENGYVEYIDLDYIHGYREVVLHFAYFGDVPDLHVWLEWVFETSSGGLIVSNEYFKWPTSGQYTTKSYPIQGDSLLIQLYNDSGVKVEDLVLYVYLTT
jgi:hypothetical protein